MRTYNSAISQELQAMLATAVLEDDEFKFKTSSGEEVAVHQEISMLNVVNILREKAEGIVSDRRKVIDMAVGTDHVYIGLTRP